MKELSEAMSGLGYKTFEKRGDLYCLFVEKGFNLLKRKGLISFIMPNKWLQAGYGKSLREYFLNHELIQLIDFGDIQIFEGVTTYPCIFVSRKAMPKTEVVVSVLKEIYSEDFYSNVLLSREMFEISKLNAETWVLSSTNDQFLIERLNNTLPKLTDVISGEAFRGIIPGLSEAFIINQETKTELIHKHNSAEELIHPIVRGRNMSRYGVPQLSECDFIILAKYGSYTYLKEKYPSIYERLQIFEPELKKRGQCNGSKSTIEKPFPGQHHWLELDNCPSDEYLEKFTKSKIMYQVFQVKPCFIFDDQGLYCNNSMWFIPSEDKGLLAILNSKLGWWLITKYCTQIQNGVQLIWKYFGQIPIANTTKELAALADEILLYNKDLQVIVGKFQRMIQRKFELEELPAKLQNWHLLTYKEFTTELSKKKIKLTLAQEAEWEDYFAAEQAKALAIKQQIDLTDRKIDRLVYEIYGLTEEEVGIVEG